MNPLTDAEIQAIKERLRKVYRGPWGFDLNHTVAQIESDGEWGTTVCRMDWRLTPADRANAEFIAHARTDIPKLLSEVERLKADKAELEEAVAAAESSGEQWELDYTALCKALDVEVTVETTDCAIDQALGNVATLKAIRDGIQPGTLEKLVEGVSLLAEEKCDHDSLSAKPALVAIEEKLDELTKERDQLAAELAKVNGLLRQIYTLAFQQTVCTRCGEPDPCGCEPATQGKTW